MVFKKSWLKQPGLFCLKPKFNSKNQRTKQYLAKITKFT